MENRVPDKITFHKCANCHGWYDDNSKTSPYCSERCKRLAYEKQRKTAFKEQSEREPTKGERILAAMRYCR